MIGFPHCSGATSQAMLCRSICPSGCDGQERSQESKLVMLTVSQWLGTSKDTEAWTWWNDLIQPVKSLSSLRRSWQEDGFWYVGDSIEVKG